MKALNLARCPDTMFVSSDLLLMKEAYSCMAAVGYSCMTVVGCTACSQSLYAVFERPSKVSVVPKIVVTTDPWLVEGDLLGTTRRRFAERKLYPDGLESNDTVGSSPGDPAPMRS